MLNEGILFDTQHDSGLKTNIISNIELKKDIFVILIDSKKFFISQAIKQATGTPYNHSSLALDYTLEEMYSFNIERDGPVIENLKETYKPDAEYAIYKITVNKEQYKKIVNTIKGIFKSKEYNFNFRGMLMTKLEPLDGTQNNKFFCSQFVAWVFEKAGIQLLDKSTDKIIPYDFNFSKHLKFVSRGKVQDFKKELLKHKIDYF